MGFYQEELLPRLQDKVMARKPNRAMRARVFDQGGDRVHSRCSRPQWRRSVLSSCYSFPRRGVGKRRPQRSAQLVCRIFNGQPSGAARRSPWRIAVMTCHRSRPLSVGGTPSGWVVLEGDSGPRSWCVAVRGNSGLCYRTLSRARRLSVNSEEPRTQLLKDARATLQSGGVVARHALKPRYDALVDAAAKSTAIEGLTHA
jgi:hypothetical protein